jgi:tRNA pseudouridine55 synthase
MSSLKFEINKIVDDEFGRKSGILLVDKEVGITSHDVVDQYRRSLGTREVGHAGTLDPFASGLLILLIGKATKLSNEFLGLDKEYIADVAIGISTDSADPEGKLKDINIENASKVTADELSKVFKILIPGYRQYVPVYSSVKLNGRKLRELARGSDSFKVIEQDGNKKVIFQKNDQNTIEIDLPFRDVAINQIELLDLSLKNIDEYKNSITEPFINELHNKEINQVLIARIRVNCSKGTYIRQLAEDIGEMLTPKVPAMLLGLQRTKIGEHNLSK